MLLSVLIPVFNEEDTILEVIDLLYRTQFQIPFEVIVINDGSTDKTAKLLQKRENQLQNLKIMTHEKNLGKSAAIKTAISYSSGEIIIIQDADMEYDPREIPKLIQPIIDDKADVVYGSRFLGKIDGMKSLHRFGNIFLSKMTKLLLSLNTTDMETGYKVLTREVIRDFKFKGSGFLMEIDISAHIAQRNYRFVELPINFHPRKYGKKKISMLDGIKAFYWIINYSFKKMN
ncbi:MAG: glycosyltransferase family 2 protein [Candidatus Hodarchaeota archaeon]